MLLMIVDGFGVNEFGGGCDWSNDIDLMNMIVLEEVVIALGTVGIDFEDNRDGLMKWM